jgi:hypothetical protein
MLNFKDYVRKNVIDSEVWLTARKIAEKCWISKTTYVKIYPMIKILVVSVLFGCQEFWHSNFVKRVQVNTQELTEVERLTSDNVK